MREKNLLGIKREKNLIGIKRDRNLLGIKVGILGGGQLARMLALAGTEMGFEIHILSQNAHDPAAQVVRHWHQGSLEDKKTLSTFFTQVDVVTVESEFVNTDLVREIESSSVEKMIPAQEQIAMFADRSLQKKWLVDHKIKTADFIDIRTTEELTSFFLKNKNGVVIKKRKFGYDGYGTFLIRKEKDLKNWLAEHNKENLTDFIVEALIPFRSELAIQFARNRSNDILTYPPVRWQAQDSKCLWVSGPIKSTVALNQLTDKIKKALTKQNYIGLIAFEIFDSAQGLYINEVAPRVHNSGHHTIESCTINQFQAHLLAIVGENLPKNPSLKSKGFAMFNLIGESERKPTFLGAPSTNSQMASLHWYGKIDNRRGRKMGHFTVLSENPKKALTQALYLKKYFNL